MKVMFILMILAGSFAQASDIVIVEEPVIVEEEIAVEDVSDSDDFLKVSFMSCFPKDKRIDFSEIAFVRLGENSKKAMAVITRNPIFEREEFDAKFFIATDVTLDVSKDQKTAVLKGNMPYLNGDNKFEEKLDLTKNDQKLNFKSLGLKLDCRLNTRAFESDDD